MSDIPRYEANERGDGIIVRDNRNNPFGWNMSVESAAKMLNNCAAKDAEIARLKAQRDRLAIDHRTILSARMPTGFADTALAERFGLRIVGGQVEEIGE